MKSALVTGAGSGIGRAVAEVLAQNGFRVGLGGRRVEALTETAERIRQAGGQVWLQSLDVTDPTSVQAFVQKALEEGGGRIDLLVNSAGVFTMRPFAETTPEMWQETLSANLTGVYLLTHAAWPHLDGGQVINIGSVAGQEPYPGSAAYCASKYGLTGLSEVLAIEGKPRRIRVHLVQPGNTHTPIWGDQAPEAVQKRMLRPEQVAEVVRWLALSPENVSLDAISIRPAVNPWKGDKT